MACWRLFRESGCLHDIFSISEQNHIERRMMDLARDDEFCRLLWTSEFHSTLERAIFVDSVIFGTNVQSRRLAMINFLSERGHYIEKVKNGEETMLKIDNVYSRVWPMTKSCLLPIQGAKLVPVYK